MNALSSIKPMSLLFGVLAFIAVLAVSKYFLKYEISTNVLCAALLITLVVIFVHVKFLSGPSSEIMTSPYKE